MRVATRTDAAGLLVLSEIYDPGWHAFIDGTRAALDVADHALRAVPIPAGEHTVELRYEPRSLRVGIIISLAALIALAVALATNVVLWRRSGAIVDGEDRGST